MICRDKAPGVDGAFYGQVIPIDGSNGACQVGFVERFNRTILDEFFREAFRKKFYANVEELQTDLDEWLHRYNHERPHRGYRNLGRRPYETFLEGKKLIGKKPVEKEVNPKKAA